MAPVTAGRLQHRVDRWFYISMALLMILLNVVAFGPSIIDPSGRNVPLPLTPLVTVHAIVAAAWLLVFLAQATLVATGRTTIHRCLGIVGAVLTAVFVVVGYFTLIEEARRGFDLSGDILPRTPGPEVANPALILGLLWNFLTFGRTGGSGIRLPTSPSGAQTPDGARDAWRVDPYTCRTSDWPLASAPAVGRDNLWGEHHGVSIHECDLRQSIAGSNPSSVIVGRSAGVRFGRFVLSLRFSQLRRGASSRRG